MATTHLPPLSSDHHSHPPPRSPSPTSHLPTHIYHHSSLLPRSIPTPALLDSVVAGAHYSGSRHDGIAVNSRRRSTLPTAPNALHLAVMDDLKEMYEGNSTKEMLQKRWRRDAVYEDPFTRCKGLHEIAPQWYALPRMYSKLTINGRRVLSSTEYPNRLIMWQKHEYTVRVTGSKKVVESILVIDIDEDGKIARLVDQRQGLDPPTRWGAQHLRRLNGRVVPWVPWLGSLPKSKSNYV
ncbi:hypothetical protein B0F90DRAFT_1626557 [Multifurca ochricompacta]|uniref:Uncharacterized protein n=1 Tax=Multifurca ochricompacta TaxID=376703 RepID=A0AAD4QPJ3_9AGAM|nr:hypothetical protein B0F90DRAFT_1626557 [Multifurca ochricompacta]